MEIAQRRALDEGGASDTDNLLKKKKNKAMRQLKC